MRTHSQIIKDAGAAKVQALLGAETSIHTVRSWVQRGSIPAEHWKVLADKRLATLDELASAASSHQARPSKGRAA